MNKAELQRFTENLIWFNQFFNDLKQLFDKVANFLSNEFQLPHKGFYYPKSRHVPALPPYYVMGQGGKSFAVEVYVIIDSSELETQDAFVKEPSLVIIKHSDGAKYLDLTNYGLRVIHNDRITQSEQADGVISGQIKGGDVQYQAFQVPFTHFTEGQNVNEAIQTEIVGTLRNLPDFQ